MFPLSRKLISPRLLAGRSARTYATPSNSINIVEVGPRDGLQNEKGVIPVDVKVELVNRLGRAGLQNIEAGSFVSPKWVPQVSSMLLLRMECISSLLNSQMAGTSEVISKMERLPGVHYPVLVPNKKGLENLFSVLSSHSSSSTPAPSDEISIFTAATDAFAKANLNTSIAESLATLAPVAKAALDRGLRVRGYLSVVIACPYSGQVDYKRVRKVTKELMEMGCYEVSLCDTVGMARPSQVSEMLEEVKKSVPAENLAVSFFSSKFA